MNNNGSIIINSNEINKTINYLSTSCANLEENMAGKLPGNFSVLADLDLYSNGISTIISQTNLVIDSHKTLISQITQHLESYASKETQLSSLLESGLGNYQSSSGSYSGDDIVSDDIMIDDVDSGKKIDASYLLENIPKLTDDEKRTMLYLLNVNKPEDTTLVSLLLDTSSSEKLYTTLKKIFKDTFQDSTNLTLEDYQKVQKILLDSICSGDILTQNLKTDSILSAKEYLLKISSENNINISDLLLENKYTKILQTALLNLYDGNEIGKYELSNDMINNFREYIDNLATYNNTTSEHLLTDKIDLVIGRVSWILE